MVADHGPGALLGDYEGALSDGLGTLRPAIYRSLVGFRCVVRVLWVVERIG